MTPADILRRYWGYDSFRECQAEIIGSVLAGRDTIGLLPTGGGKSVTFQVPAMLLGGVTVVITPLISLMKDQVDNLRARGIPAGCLHSAMNRHESNLTLERLMLGKLRIIYLSPERLAVPSFVALLRPLDVRLIVADEAHCISQWGYDFRPSYLRVGTLRDVWPTATMMALTASATPAVVADISDRLRMRSPALFSRSFARESISYIVRRCDSTDKTSMLLHILQRTAGTAIVYTRSRRRTAELARTLADAGISALPYHAGMAPEDKNARQDAWMRGEVRVMVATNAFGMGIDKPDVRLVVHFDIPPSLEEYYQEAGRAARDGKPAWAVILATAADRGVLRRRLAQEFPPREYIRDIYDKACVFSGIAMGEGDGHSCDFDFGGFCEHYRLHARTASAALDTLNRSGIIEWGEEMGARSRIMVTADRREFYAMDLPPLADAVIQCIMRRYPGIFADFVPIDETRIAFELALTVEDVYQQLLLLARLHAVQYIPRRRLPYLYLPVRREEPRHIIIPRTVLEDLRERAAARMEAVVDYVFNDSGCRVERMLRYFGQSDATPCGTCDICRDTRRRSQSDSRADAASAWVDRWFDRSDTLTAADLGAVTPAEATEIISELRARSDRGLLHYLPPSTWRLP